MTERRLERLRTRLAAENLGAILVSQPESRRYISGFNGSAGYLFISAEQALLATDFRYTEQAGRQSPAFEVVQTSGGMGNWLPDLLARLGSSRLAFEAEHLTVVSHQRLREALEGMEGRAPELKPTEGIVESLRRIKEPQELESLAKAIHVADAAFDTVAATLRPGMTEREVGWLIEQEMRENGADGESFPTIVASGPNAALPHHSPSDRPLQEGEPIVIDMGARVDGYCSDMTRTICLGLPDETFTRIYSIVHTAQLAAISTVAPGMTGEEADGLARSVIEEAGYGESFGHGLGHGVGLAVHEAPRLGKGAQERLEEGMVFTIEPGIYISGWGGVRIEDVVILEDEKARVLSRATKKETVGAER